MSQNEGLHFLVLGVSHKQAPLAIREKLCVSDQNDEQVLGRIIEQSGASGGVLLSTCNRTEVYLSGGVLPKAKQALFGEYAAEGTKKGWFYQMHGTAAVTHLFRVTSGLESLILGEDEILRQVKKAYGIAAGCKHTDGLVNMVFHAALRTAKKMKTETGLSNIALSVGTISVNRAKEVLGDLSGKQLLLIGLGDVGYITLKDFLYQGVQAHVTYRDYHKTRQRLVEKGDKLPENICMIPHSDRSQCYNQADIIVSATSSPQYAVTGVDFQQAVSEDKQRVLIDLAVPRDMDDAMAAMPNSVYYSIDDLKAISDDNQLLREQKSREGANMIIQAVEEFEKQWLFRTNRLLMEQIKVYAKTKARYPLAEAYGAGDNAGLQKAVMDSFDSMLEDMVFQVRESVDKQDLEAFFRCIRSVLERNDLKKTENIVYAKPKSA